VSCVPASTNNHCTHTKVAVEKGSPLFSFLIF
jgi:hypothetical protein